MKKSIPGIISVLIILLFVYTASSKLLGYERFIFQMKQAPFPLMKTLAPTFGWVIPTIEIMIALALTASFFYPTIKIKSLLAATALMVIFDIYIGSMLLSGSELPCSCGGIISAMGWKEHLIFNALFILGGIASIKILSKHDTAKNNLNRLESYKELSRA